MSFVDDPRTADLHVGVEGSSDRCPEARKGLDALIDSAKQAVQSSNSRVCVWFGRKASGSRLTFVRVVDRKLCKSKVPIVL